MRVVRRVLGSPTASPPKSESARRTCTRFRHTAYGIWRSPPSRRRALGIWRRRAKAPVVRAPLTALSALALGLILGFVLGGVGPRRELVASQEEIASLEEALEEAPRGSGLRSSLPGFDCILRPPARDSREGQRDEDSAGEEGEEGEGARMRAQRNAFGDAGVAPYDDEDENEDESRYSAFQRAASVQRVRMVQSRRRSSNKEISTRRKWPPSTTPSRR